MFNNLFQRQLLYGILSYFVPFGGRSGNESHINLASYFWFKAEPDEFATENFWINRYLHLVLLFALTLGIYVFLESFISDHDVGGLRKELLDAVGGTGAWGAEAVVDEQVGTGVVLVVQSDGQWKTHVLNSTSDNTHRIIGQNV